MEKRIEKTKLTCERYTDVTYGLQGRMKMVKQEIEKRQEGNAGNGKTRKESELEEKVREEVARERRMRQTENRGTGKERDSTTAGDERSQQGEGESSGWRGRGREGEKARIEKEAEASEKLRKDEEKKGKEGKERKNKNWKVAFWNVAGLDEKDKDFWNNQKKWDVIVMQETWLEEKGWEMIKWKLPKGDRWRAQHATRKSKKGRAMGGMALGVRDNVEKTKEEDQEEKRR